ASDAESAEVDIDYRTLAYDMTEVGTNHPVGFRVQRIVHVDQHLSLGLDHDNAVLPGRTDERDIRLLIDGMNTARTGFHDFPQSKRTQPGDGFRIPVERIKHSLRFAAKAAQRRLVPVIFVWVRTEVNYRGFSRHRLNRPWKDIPLIAECGSVEPWIGGNQGFSGVDQQASMADIGHFHVDAPCIPGSGVVIMLAAVYT